MSTTTADLRRELEKARLTLISAQSHLAAHAEANAALHCAPTVLYSPLHAQVTASIASIEHALQRTEQALLPSPLEQLGRLMLDLDRCAHGRHAGDDCGSCEGPSRGNPHNLPGMVLGYTVHGDSIVIPEGADRHDPKAWRRARRERAVSGV